MNVVQPIKKLEDIQKIKKILAKKPRDALLFSFGINTGLRISDILSLDVGNVKDRDYIEIREKKTNKYKKFSLNRFLKEEIDLFVEGLASEQPLFYTQKHCRLDRAQAYEFLESLSQNADLYLFTSRNLMLATKWLINNNLDKFFKDVTNIKLPSFLYIDDRTICFKGDYHKTLEEIENFKVYWK